MRPAASGRGAPFQRGDTLRFAGRGMPVAGSASDVRAAERGELRVVVGVRAPLAELLRSAAVLGGAAGSWVVVGAARTAVPAALGRVADAVVWAGDTAHAFLSVHVFGWATPHSRWLEAESTAK